MVMACPMCGGAGKLYALGGPIRCSQCAGTRKVARPPRRKREPPTFVPTPLPEPAKIQTPEEEREDRVQAGAISIAVVSAGGSLFLAVTSSSLSITPLVVLTLVVLVAAYLTFAHPLAFVSSGLMLLVSFLLSVVEFLEVAIPIALKAGVFLLVGAAILYVAYVFVTT